MQSAMRAGLFIAVLAVPSLPAPAGASPFEQFRTPFFLSKDPSYTF